MGFSQLKMTDNPQSYNNQKLEQEDYYNFKRDQKSTYSHDDINQPANIIVQDQNKKSMIVDVSSNVQLIAINDTDVNFNVGYQLTSLDQVPFLYSVVTQTFLDSGKEIKYEIVNGNKIGRFQNKDNEYESYYLVIKSVDEKQSKVGIKLMYMPLMSSQNDHKSQNNHKSRNNHKSQKSLSYTSTTKNNLNHTDHKNKLLQYIILFVCLIFVIFFIFKFSSRKNNANIASQNFNIEDEFEL